MGVAITDPNEIRDGYLTFQGGVDMWTSPNMLPPHKVAFAENCTFRGNGVSPRPGFKRVDLSFTAADQTTIDAMKLAWATGRFQGAESFKKANADAIILVSISGRIFSVDLVRGTIKENSLAGDLNSARAPQVWIESSPDFAVISNAQESDLFFSGTDMRRATVGELPVGSGPLCYGMGRFWVAMRDQWIASDLSGNPDSGNPTPYNFRDSVLHMSENDYLNEGGSFGLPLSSGPITAMRFLANVDTTLGQGALLIHTPNGVFGATLPFDRTTWKALTYPSQTMVLINNGALSHWSCVLVNGDMFYRARDGIRSVVMARRDFGSWGNVPISREVQPILTEDDEHLLNFCSAVLFDNRLIMTCSPVLTESGCYHRGMIALDFDPISTLGQRAPPAFEGLWTGLNVLKLLIANVGGEDRCFAFALNANNQIDLWEITKDERFDETDKRIPWTVETRSWHFNKPFDAKELKQADLWLKEVWGEVGINAKFRSDDYPGWINWINKTIETTISSTTVSETTYSPQTVSRVSLGQPPDTEDAVNEKFHRKGCEFAIRLDMLGFAEISQMRVFGRNLPEGVFGRP